VKTWDIFLLTQNAARGEFTVDEAEVKRICEAFKARVATGVPA